MESDSEYLDREADSIISRRCSRPVETRSGQWVRCGSRVRSRCPSCAELYRGDWAAIARSGIFDGPVENFRFYLLTLTAPSFGRVHRVPRSDESAVSVCGCGARHLASDAALRGVPLDPGSYDYAGQVSWNRDAGLLWDRTRRRLRDRWGSLEYFIVREWQDRGVLHGHAILRVCRLDAPEPAVLGAAARSAVAVSKIDGSLVGWGDQVRCDAFRADGDGARTIWYLSKALNYVMKDTTREGMGGRNQAWEHLAALEAAARRIRCSTPCVPSSCRSRVHDRFGSKSHVVSASRRTANRTGWSFTGLTRTVQRRLRSEWAAANAEDLEQRAERGRAEVDWALEWLAERSRREARAQPAVVP
jgi:hypothetical protein